MEKDFLKRINREKNDFETTQIQIVPGFTFNQKRQIEQDYRYYNSKFEFGEIDEDGDKKYFYNINRNPCDLTTDKIDFDAKDVRMFTSGGGNPRKTWYQNRDFNQWMEDKQFGKVLNRIFYELPIFGSVVLKIISGKIYFVDLRNFVIDQSSDTLDQSNYIIEKHPYTVMEFKKVAKEMGWDDKVVKETIEKFRQMKDAKHIMVYERYGEVEDEAGNWEYKRVYIADVGIDENIDGIIIPYKGVELKSDIVNENPYWEFHLYKMLGRWLGISIIEILTEPQINTNESENLLNKASYIRAIVLFKSQDPGIAGKNIKTGSSNGDIIDTSAGDINQLNIFDNDLAHFGERHNRWMRNRDELVFSYDVVQGERLPAGTPLGSAQIALAQNMSHFERRQEDVALDIKEMIKEVILPQFDKDSTPEHILRLIGKDLDEYIAMIKDELVDVEVVKQWTKGNFITEYDKKVIGIAIENGMKKDKEYLKKLPKDFYKDNKYDIRIDITGESIDTRIKSATMFAILQAITTDPTILQDPVKKKILYTIAEYGGVSLNDFIGGEQKSIEQQMTETQGAGGGVSKMSMPQNPMAGQTAKTI